MTDYESLKVPELKALLKERSLSQSGRKADLIIRLQTADIDEAGAAEEEAQPQGDAAPAEAQPRDDEQQPLHNGAVDGNDKKSPQAPNEAEMAQSETVPGEAADAKQCSPDKPEEAVQDTEQEPPAAGEVEDKDTAEPPSGLEAPPAESDGHGVDADHSKADHAEAAEAVAAPAEIPATEDDAVQVEPEANDDAPPADSPARGHQTSPPKMAEHNEESDSLSLGDTDSEQNDPKGNAQGAADSTRSERQPMAIPESTDKDKCNSAAAKPDPDEPEDTVASAGLSTRRTRTSPDPGAAPAPAAKRKHADIVFPDAAAPAERPAPAKREKVDLVVPEATDETRALRISGLKRPLREAELKQILSKTGTIEGFWIDSCKTHCYVVYGTVGEARETRAAVDGLQWPPRCRSVMQPKYVALEEAQGMIDSKGAATLTRVPSNAAGDAGAAAKPSGSAEDSVIDMTKAAAVPPPAPRAPRADASQVAAGGSAPAEITPLELFNLTEARPSLYWLPLTEEQVTQRRGVDAARKARAATASTDAEKDGDEGTGGGDGGDGGEKDGADADEGAGGGEAGAKPDGAQDGDVEMIDADGVKGPDDDDE